MKFKIKFVYYNIKRNKSYEKRKTYYRNKI